MLAIAMVPKLPAQPSKINKQLKMHCTSRIKIINNAQTKAKSRRPSDVEIMMSHSPTKKKIICTSSAAMPEQAYSEVTHRSSFIKKRVSERSRPIIFRSNSISAVYVAVVAISVPGNGDGCIKRRSCSTGTITSFASSIPVPL